MRDLLSVLPHRLALPYALAFYAGLRRGEINALRAEDVSGEEVRVHPERGSLDPVVGFKAPKNGTGRAIPLFAPLRPYLELAPREGLLVPGERASTWGARDLSHLAEDCDAYWKPAEMRRILLHEGRHSFATALVRAGYDVGLVSEWVGHGSPATTLRIYVKPRGREAGATALMDNYLMGAR
jgi:integrase